MEHNTISLTSLVVLALKFTKNCSYFCGLLLKVILCKHTCLLNKCVLADPTAPSAAVTAVSLLISWPKGKDVLYKYYFLHNMSFKALPVWQADVVLWAWFSQTGESFCVSHTVGNICQRAPEEQSRSHSKAVAQSGLQQTPSHAHAMTNRGLRMQERWKSQGFDSELSGEQPQNSFHTLYSPPQSITCICVIFGFVLHVGLCLILLWFQQFSKWHILKKHLDILLLYRQDFVIKLMF